MSLIKAISEHSNGIDFQRDMRAALVWDMVTHIVNRSDIPIAQRGATIEQAMKTLAKDFGPDIQPNSWPSLRNEEWLVAAHCVKRGADVTRSFLWNSAPDDSLMANVVADALAVEPGDRCHLISDTGLNAYWAVQQANTVSSRMNQDGHIVQSQTHPAPAPHYSVARGVGRRWGSGRRRARGAPHCFLILQNTPHADMSPVVKHISSPV